MSAPPALPSKSAQISALVQALRSGKLSKDQLFSQLQALQRGGQSIDEARPPLPTAGGSGTDGVRETVRQHNMHGVHTAVDHTVFTSAIASLLHVQAHGEEARYGGSGPGSVASTVDADAEARYPLHDSGAAPVQARSNMNGRVSRSDGDSNGGGRRGEEVAALHNAYSAFLAAAQGGQGSGSSTAASTTPRDTRPPPAPASLPHTSSFGRATANMVGGVLTAGQSFSGRASLGGAAGGGSEEPRAARSRPGSAAPTSRASRGLEAPTSSSSSVADVRVLAAQPPPVPGRVGSGPTGIYMGNSGGGAAGTPGWHTSAVAQKRRSASQGPTALRQQQPLPPAAAYAAGEEAELTFQPRITQLPPQYGTAAQRVLATIPFQGVSTCGVPKCVERVCLHTWSLLSGVQFAWGAGHIVRVHG